MDINTSVSIGDIAQSAAVLLGAAAIWLEMRRSHRDHQRQQQLDATELRWRKANAARELLTDIHKHPCAADAIRMLDWGESAQEYRLPNGRSASIDMTLVRTALSDLDSDDATARYIRECFDWLLYYLDRIGQYVESDFVLLDDVQPVLSPYAESLYQSGIDTCPLIAARKLQFIGKFLRKARCQSPELAHT